MPEIDKKPDLHISVISPSCYDDNGILRQYSRMLIVPPVFAALDGIVERAAQDSNLSITITHHNERVEKGKEYLNSVLHPNTGAKNNAVFMSVKSFEVPRAIDIATEIRSRDENAQIVVGGPGITLADKKTLGLLVEENISFCVGEGENIMGTIIEDTVSHDLKPAYWQSSYVDMRRAPLPTLPDRRDYRQTMMNLTSIATSRGCPFNCSYCCCTKLEGRKLTAERSRNVDDCVEWIREAHLRGFGIFLSDNNFLRSRIYKDLQKPLIHLNEEFDGKIFLLSQIDVKDDILKEAEVLAAMGMKQVFTGMESRDPSVLADVKKKQNDPAEYQLIVDTFNRHGIMFQSGVMMGFPRQTPQSIREDARYFGQLLDMPHCYAVTPLPGSDDYPVAVASGEIINWDLNFYDTMHVVRDWFENMTPQEAQAAYWQCFFDLFPANKLWENRHLPSWKPTLKGRTYSRFLAEVGNRFYGHPFHFMMDGIPHLPPTQKIHRPKDSFRGFELTSDDLENREQFLAEVTSG